MTEALALGATIGILGGGQLGRMLSVAASRLGFQCHIFDPATGGPASQVAAFHTQASFSDIKALKEFAKSVEVITFEFENIPTDALDLLEQHCTVFPDREALRKSQDRLDEKQFLTSLGLRTAAFAPVHDLASLTQCATSIGLPAILKTRKFGYDGKGQRCLNSTDDIAAASEHIGETPSLLEGYVDFSREISVIGARSTDGHVACYDPGENLHKDGILHSTTLPADLNVSQRTDAVLIAAKIMNELNYVGVMGVELFVTADGLIVNEIAPRVHNSGHWTQAGCAVDQFEQHIRAIAGWPLGDGSRHSNVKMTNLIGSDIDEIQDLAGERANSLHLYGKSDAKPGRKMGHVNQILGPAT